MARRAAKEGEEAWKREARLGQGLQEVGKRPAVGRPGAGALLEQGFPDPAAAFLVLEIEVADNAGVELCVGMVRHRSQRLVEGLEGVVVAAERPVHDAEVGPHVGVGGIEGEGPFVDRDRLRRPVGIEVGVGERDERVLVAGMAGCLAFQRRNGGAGVAAGRDLGLLGLQGVPGCGSRGLRCRRLALHLALIYGLKDKRSGKQTGKEGAG